MPAWSQFRCPLHRHPLPFKISLSILPGIQIPFQKCSGLLEILCHSCRYLGHLTAPVNAIHASFRQMSQVPGKFRHLQKVAVQGWLWSHVTSVSSVLVSHDLFYMSRAFIKSSPMPLLNQAPNPYPAELASSKIDHKKIRQREHLPAQKLQGNSAGNRCFIPTVANSRQSFAGEASKE